MAESVAQGTVRGISDEIFNPEADAAFLYEAFRGLGTNDRQLRTLITDRTNAQRQAIAAAYEEQQGQKLVDRIMRETSGKYERVLVALMLPPAHYDAYFLRQAMDGIGTTESLLNEILCTRSGPEIAEISAAFEEQCGKNLAGRVSEEIGFMNENYKQFLLRCITQGRPGDDVEVDEGQVAEDAERLAAAGVDKWGTDESVFIDVFASRSFPHLRQVCIAYQSAKGHTLESACKSELGGHFEDAIVSTLGHAFRPSEFWGEKLRDTMKGLGTNDEDLIRILIARSERDLATIRDNYASTMGEDKSLEAWIAGDTSGHYEKVLLSIVGADQREPIVTEGDDAEAVEEYEPPTDSGWQPIDGSLKNIATARNGELYGVNNDGHIWYRTFGTEWQQIGGVLIQIDVGGPECNIVVGCNDSGGIYRLKPNRQGWDQLDGRLKWVSVGNMGQLWGCNDEDSIYFSASGFGDDWTQVDGSLRQVSCDVTTGEVYGTNSENQIYYRAGIDGDNLVGEGWEHIEGRLTHVTSANGRCMGVNAENTIYQLMDRESSAWEQVDGGLVCVDVGVTNQIVGCNADGNVFVRTNFFA